MRRFDSRLSPILLGLLAILLPVSAAAAYCLIHRAGEADRMERIQFLEAAMSGFRGDLTETTGGLFAAFRPSPQNDGVDWNAYLVEVLNQWRASTSRARCFGNLYLAKPSDENEIILLRFDAAKPDKGFERRDWPTSLEPFRTVLFHNSRSSNRPLPIPPSGVVFTEIDDRLVTVFPLTTIDGESRPTDQPERPAPGPARRRVRLAAWCFFEFDQAYLQESVFPELVNRHFQGPELSEFQVAVVSARTGRAVYQTDPGFPSPDERRIDAEAPLFRRPPGADAPGGGPERGGPPPDDGRRRERPSPGRSPELDGPSGWRLIARHRSGSIDEVVAQIRRRNLALGFGVLALVFGSAAMLVRTTDRARALAKRQMEFVAGVSHELRTPLAVIQSAGFNLASGRVQDPSRVKHYGSVIQNEGLRLSGMVEQMLGWAGIQSGRQIHDFQSLDVGDLVARVVDDQAAAFKNAGWKVETEIEKGLPLVSGDARALESVVRNLLQNALKYADDGKRLRVAVGSVHHSRKPEISIAVADRGPGIDARDLPHIFDPFFRGNRTASALPGAGLGLSLLKRHVEAHRGRVAVESTPGSGTTFTVFLPAIVR